MTDPNPPVAGLDAATLAELNDLLQLDHDAVAAYTLAVQALANRGRRETVLRFRADHERHIADLSRVVQRHGGTPATAPHASSGAFRRAMQKLGALGGDREVMLAFRANEALSAEKYTRAATHAGAWPEEVRAVVAAAADDEARHYEWAEGQLETLGAGPATPMGRVAGVAGKVHAGMAAGAERLERGAQAVRARLPERLADVRLPSVRLPEVRVARPSGTTLAVGAVAAGVSFLVTVAMSKALRGRR